MTETLTVYPQTFDYYNYYVMCNFVFEEQKPLIQCGYTYEENSVYYCTNATEKGVYCYTYCLNNPLMYTDPTGMLLDDYGLSPSGHVTLLRETDDDFDRLIVLDKNGKETNKQMIVYNRNILPDLAKFRKGFDGTSYAVSESSETGDVFLFASANSNVEWGLSGFRSNGRNEYIVYTDHLAGDIRPAEDWFMFKDKSLLFGIHSHWGNNMNDRKASGFGYRYHGDMSKISEYYNRTGNIPDKYIYHPYSESLIKYTPWDPQAKIQTGIKYSGGLLFLYK